MTNPERLNFVVEKTRLLKDVIKLVELEHPKKHFKVMANNCYGLLCQVETLINTEIILDKP